MTQRYNDVYNISLSNNINVGFSRFTEKAEWSRED